MYMAENGSDMVVVCGIVRGAWTVRLFTVGSVVCMHVYVCVYACCWLDEIWIEVKTP